MTNANPYSSPTTHQGQPVIRESQTTICERPSSKRLWIAYGIAPLVAPLLAAIAVAAFAFAYQATHPEDVEVNPMSIVFAPAFLLITGIPASYAVAGVIGMPIAFWLRRLGRLNGFTIHGAALLWAAVPGAVLAVVGLLVALSKASLSSFTESLAGALALFLGLAPFVLLSATTFWLIGVRRWKQSVDAEPPGCDG